MPTKLESGGNVLLWSGWEITLPPASHGRNKDGSWSAWGENWTVDASIVEMSGRISASKLLGNIEPSARIDGNGWIGSREILNATDNGRSVFRLATKLCAEDIFMSCWVSFLSEDQIQFADSIVQGVTYRAPQKQWWKIWQLFGKIPALTSGRADAQKARAAHHDVCAGHGALLRR